MDFCCYLLHAALQAAVLSAGHTVMLSTHSMEEAEALADRVLLLSAGAARCCSTLQELRAKHAGSCTLMVHVRVPAVPLAAAAASSAASKGCTSAASDQHPDAVTTGATASAGVKTLARHLLAVLPGSSVLAKEPGVLLLRVPVGTGPMPVQQQQRRLWRRRQQQQQQHISSVADVLGALESCPQSVDVVHYTLSCGSLETELAQMFGLHRSASPADLDRDL
jgi:ABC-type multidrug transport system ATPase subunit